MTSDTDIIAEAKEGEDLYWKNMAKVAQEAVSLAIQSSDTPPAALVSAAKEIWDRAYGKVAEKMEHSGPGGGGFEIIINAPRPSIE